jgi:TolA-binding protein
LLPPSVADAVALSQLFQGARDVYQLAVLGVSFLLTGNLAAPVVASAVNGAFLSAMARRALERNKARSATLAKELEQLNDRLAEMAKQQRQRRAERLRREREEEDAAREKAAAAGRAAAGAAVGGRLGETLSALDSMLAATEEKKA